MRSVELFTGCGCLALGTARAGFEHVYLAEKDGPSIRTLMENRDRKLKFVRDWSFEQRDVRDVDWQAVAGRERVDLVAGGPPCQPFSIGGRHAGPDDPRDMWSEAIRAVRELRPRAFLFENVKGLMRASLAEYVEMLRMELSSPGLVRRSGEHDWEYRVRLLAAYGDPEYEVEIVRLNAADFGAPQQRERVIVLGIHCDEGVKLDPPNGTGGFNEARLLWDQWVADTYWRRHWMSQPDIDTVATKREKAQLEKWRRLGKRPTGNPWRTCRDAFAGLGDPRESTGILNHSYQPGAREYVGHTGSRLDRPAKALKAGVHGVPGGENMMRLDGGGVRYFTVREAARLQGLPDSFGFPNAWSENMRQLGNAVPVPLAESMATYLYSLLASTEVREKVTA